jgi:hypothetical protein
VPSDQPLSFGFVGDGSILGWLVVRGEPVRSGLADIHNPFVETAGTVIGDSRVAVTVIVDVGVAVVEVWAFRATVAKNLAWKALP